MNWQARKKVDSERKAEEFEANKNFKAQNAKVVCVSLCPIWRLQNYLFIKATGELVKEMMTQYI